MKINNRLLILMMAFILAMSLPSYGKKLVTKGAIIEEIASTKSIKEQVNKLYSWTIGYDISKRCIPQLTPIINYVLTTPDRVLPDGRTVVLLTTSITDPSGPRNISAVNADLSSIGKMSGMVLVDNGDWGDKVAGDGIFTLQANIAPNTSIGEKEIPVAVANKKGWKAVSRTMLTVEKNKNYLPLTVSPSSIKADGSNYLNISCDTHGISQKINKVVADLSAFQSGKEIQLVKQGNGTYSAQVLVGAYAVPGDNKITVWAIKADGSTISNSINVEVFK